MKTLFCYTIVLLPLLMASCKGDEMGPPPKFPINEKSYIQGFFELNAAYISLATEIKVNKEKQVVSIMDTSFDKSKIYEIRDGIGMAFHIGMGGLDKGLIDWGKNNPYFDYYNELIEKIGDTAYNSKIMHGLDPYDIIIAVADTLQFVNITCDKDFDENHPAGSSLNDIFSVYFEDPYAVIKNGYKSVTGSNYYSLDGIPEEFPYALYGNKVSEINLLDKPYIGAEWYFVLESAPENTDEYLFSVSVANIQGKIIKNTARETMKIKGSKN